MLNYKILYVLIIRKLCDADVFKKQLEEVQELLFKWHKTLQKLYTKFEMTYTARAH